VPLLGDVLEQRQTQSVKSEFIILLKPIVASALGDRSVLNESNKRFRELNRAIDPFANN
jgi:MSHA biogenesis protein MshL